ncbi:uncharacterized mitochondrial protein AtMg00810-like [Manihot esculenta]|uniref:uncharacterized mitochondrial protein AtMg00810-like n=1 Tax=Manihot esculenta TaxID=3983 RepID=UPI000B5D2565|nr:uncharacterized mitochondrial protein AtMg00810-like [Manihot esculenta]
MDLFPKARMVDCKGISTPASSKDKITATQGPLFSDSTLYRSIVGGLQYLSLTRPKICYSASNIEDWNSITSFAIFMGKYLISWNSKKQQIVAKSSTEAEYRAIDLAITELTWIQSLLRDIDFASK